MPDPEYDNKTLKPTRRGFIGTLTSFLFFPKIIPEEEAKKKTIFERSGPPLFPIEPAYHKRNMYAKLYQEHLANIERAVWFGSSKE